MKLKYKIMLSTAAGATIGYAYYYFIGCNGGSCPITSNWHISTLYGAAMGLILSLPFGKKNKDENNGAGNQ
jgi:hypothetical protein